MADLKMKLNTNNELRLKMKSNEAISMKFDDYQKFKEEDPIFKDSPAYKITNADINNWNHKSNFSGSYNDLKDKPNLNIYATRSEVNEKLSEKVDKETGMGLSQNSFTTEEKNKLASLENYDDSEIVSELSNKADISDIPTKTSELLNDSGYITKDVDDLTYYPTNDSVNSIVALKQNLIDSENLLSADLVDDTSTTNKFVTATDITTWNNKSDFSGNYNDLTNKPTIPTLTSQLTNDSGFITSANIPTKTSDLTNDSGFITMSDIPTIPTKTSDLNNDSGFITKSVNDLTNYTLSSSLATVATSGSYTDLTNKPTIPSKTSDLTNDSNFATTSYVDNAVKVVYSTTETRIGTWIDGKPLYRKVINAGNITASNTTIETIQNIDVLVSIKGSAYNSQFGQKYGIPNVHNDMALYYINLLVAGNGVVIRYGSGFNQFSNVFAILEYTKTTD